MLAASLMLMFAVAVRRILRNSDDGGYLSEVFLLGTTAVATLLVVAQAMQLAFAERADDMTAEVVFSVGVHFVGVLIGLWGFVMAATAFAWAYGVFTQGVLPRWTAYLAVLALAINLIGTTGVFFCTGAFCLDLSAAVGVSVQMRVVVDRAARAASGIPRPAGCQCTQQ